MSDDTPIRPKHILEPYEPPAVRTMTVVEAREELETHLGEGATCVVCGQFAKVYRRALRGALAVSLIRMYQFFKRNPGVEWLEDTPGYLRSVGANATNDAALLRHWNLIEARPGVRDDSSTRTGVFRLTPEGKGFVIGVLKVKRFALIYNQTFLGLDGELISIHEALGTHFNYRELMEAA